MNTSNKSLSIKDWSVDDRPREKLLKNGVQTLSDSELIGILLGSGNREMSAVDLAKQILNFAENNLNKLAKLDIEDLLMFKGVGDAKAVTLVTALELGKRRRLSEFSKPKHINGSKSVYEIMLPLMQDLKHEEFWVLFLNNSGNVIEKHCFSKGGITGTLVDVRLIFKKALALTSTSIVIVHNHPSGALHPSQADIQITNKIKESGEILDIKLLDHLIITEKSYFSFADSSQL